MFRHPETLLPFVPKYCLHSLVRSEPLLILWILGSGVNKILQIIAICEHLNLQVLLLEVSPQLLDNLCPRYLQTDVNKSMERHMHTCSPFLVPMILASSGETLSGI